MELEIDKIKVVGNPRVDFSGLDELVASVKEQGVLVPLIVNKKNELIAGERRLRASKKAGLSKVPVRVVELHKEAVAEAKLIENIQRKGLNAVEEGIAFKKYLSKTKHTEEHLAKKLGKPINYVKRRLLVAGLSEKIKNAVIQNKIQVGHALLLAKMNDTEANKFLKDIVAEKHSVERAKSALQYSKFSMELSEACFETKVCKNCQYNGSVQSGLFDTGRTLKGKCLNQKCFLGKVREFVNAQRKENKDLLWEGEYYESPKGFIEGADSWRAKQDLTPAYIKKVRTDRKPESYLVSIDDRGKVREFFKPVSTKKVAPQEGINVTREQRLKSKVRDYKYEEMKKIGSSFAKYGMKQVKVLCLYQLLKNYQSSIDKSFNDIFGYSFSFSYSDKFLKTFYGEDEKKLDLMYVEVCKVAMYDLDYDEVEKSSKAFGLDWKKHFLMNTDFLDLHTKDQLVDLGKELGVAVEPSLKLKGMKACFMEKNNLEKVKGKVPKVLS